jgi:REP element-mobilizing transposase RayT
MARQLRIEYPGALYHVFSRGNQKQLVYLSDDDRSFFLNYLRKAHKKFGAIVHTYCLMPNHFHLFLETPYGNLSRLMHYVITSYTTYFNKKHDRHGHLFQGRFKSVLIEAVGYAKELSRYIHLNPVRSGIIDKPDRYPWSSLGYYRGIAKPESWLDTSLVLRLFGEQAIRSRKAYVEFVMDGIGREAPASIRESLRTGILGSEEFIARTKRERLAIGPAKSDRERPQLRRLRRKPSLAEILNLSEKILGPRNKHLVPIAVLISHENSDWKLKEIGGFFSLSISSVSNACLKARAAIAGNAALGAARREIERGISEDESEN